MDTKIIDYPKIKSPFVRKKNSQGKYVCTPEIEEGFSWVFEDNGVRAVDKLHGTNICAIFDRGKLIYVDNRKNRVLKEPCISTNMSPPAARIIHGILNSIEKKWLEKNITGRIYGELVGPTFNGNIHCLDQCFFVPFMYLYDHCHWKTFLSNQYPKTFESIKEWFRDLPSLFTKRMANLPELAEGLVFHHPDGQRKAKLRRDMFDFSRNTFDWS